MHKKKTHSRRVCDCGLFPDGFFAFTINKLLQLLIKSVLIIEYVLSKVWY